MFRVLNISLFLYSGQNKHHPPCSLYIITYDIYISLQTLLPHSDFSNSSGKYFPSLFFVGHCLQFGRMMLPMAPSLRTCLNTQLQLQQKLQENRNLSYIDVHNLGCVSDCQVPISFEIPTEHHRVFSYTQLLE